MLIIRGEINGFGVADLRIVNGVIAAIGQLGPAPNEPVLDLNGGAVLPGLNDHHIHLLAYAASLDSVRCGPPEVNNATELIETLAAAQPNASGWVRGIGYHDSVAGGIDRHWLDRHSPAVPIRIQHRSGRLWILNSVAMERLVRTSRQSSSKRETPTRVSRLRTRQGQQLPQNVVGETEGQALNRRQSAWLPLEGRPNQDGRFYDQDQHLARLWGRALPPIDQASRQLAAYGITGVTDLTPSNDTSAAARLEQLHKTGRLRQKVRVGGTLGMEHTLAGPTKIHLHESSLPDFEALSELVGNSHASGREVAVHCVTEAELAFALAAFRSAGVREGDRIEHASVTPPALLSEIRDLGLWVITQPHFIEERGDAYLRDMRAPEHSWMYRCRGFLDKRIPLAAGSDAPFGQPDPWRAMRAAVKRQTAAGKTLGEAEAVTPEQALSLFLGSLRKPTKPRRIEVGVCADLCLLDHPWRIARKRLDSADVRATICAGRLVYAKFPPDREKT